MVADVDVIPAVMTDGKAEAFAAAAKPGIDQLIVFTTDDATVVLDRDHPDPAEGVEGQIQALLLALLGELEALGQLRWLDRCIDGQLIEQVGDRELQRKSGRDRPSGPGEGDAERATGGVDHAANSMPFRL